MGVQFPKPAIEGAKRFQILIGYKIYPAFIDRFGRDNQELCFQIGQDLSNRDVIVMGIGELIVCRIAGNGGGIQLTSSHAIGASR